MPAVRYVGLIRAIGPATHLVMSMAAVRAACQAAGFGEVSTLLATGNVLLTSQLPRAEVLSRLSSVIGGFGLANAVIVRTHAELSAAVAANPFPESAAHGDRLIAMFLAGPAQSDGWIADHAGPERLQAIGTTVYVDYPGDIPASRLTPGRIEKRLGVIATFRNWNTVTRILGALDRGADLADCPAPD